MHIRQFRLVRVATLLVSLSALLAACETTKNTNAQPPLAQLPKIDRSELFDSKFNPAQDVAAVLILPTQSREPNLKKVAEQFKNAADMAMKDGAGNLKLAVLPTDETVASTVAAVKKATNGGADIILGPLLSDAVKATAPVMASSGVSAIAFSNDKTAADPRGTYLIGHLPQQEVGAVVQYAAKQGYKRFYAVLPDTIYGRRVGEAFQEAVKRQGEVPIKTWYYRPGQSVRNLGAVLNDSQKRAVFVPVPEDAIKFIVPQSKNKQNLLVMGNGMWHKTNIMRTPILQGAVFAAPHPKIMEAFRARYARTFRQQPNPTAALAYDAVRMSIALSLGTQTPARERMTQAAITRRNGFQGITGTFRLLDNGLSERIPAIVALRGGKPVVVQPSPNAF